MPQGFRKDGTKLGFQLGNKAMLGKKHSEETKIIMRKLKIGKPLTDEHKKNIGLAFKGKVPWNKGKHYKFSEETRLNHKNIGRPSSSKGKHWKLSDETKEKMKKNNAHYWLGKEVSEERKEKLRKALSGDKCHFWKGGISFEPYSIDWTKTLKESIRQRDNFTCKICGRKQGKRKFDVHHIDYDKKNCNPDNLITLCLKCHRKTNHKRDYWINLFNK